jgi:hypothetical protein
LLIFGGGGQYSRSLQLAAGAEGGVAGLGPG